MTEEQTKNEAASIETFVDDIVKRVRKRGTNASVTGIIAGAARTAAEWAPRRADGTIDIEIAMDTLRAAINLYKLGLVL